ncbi:hypothetical protein [Paenibacillus sp. J2TS4]|uniref:hypothetical protein n=1 Tax=Paenibacillus sp. J2TS4 TaxID=2807194 RepID=UPI001B03BC78|nr:hypothetical protein [Paenibacillus sp. J2TS4]GIP34132.1 hypothetical protein J2TS4_33420 [Paenibacillus sp. J2TS4]
MSYFNPQTPGVLPYSYSPSGFPSHSAGPWSASPQHAVNPRVLLDRVRPLVNYGLREAHKTGVRHAMTEVALIAYLMGMGYSPQQAHKLVESWEIDETFPR